VDRTPSTAPGPRAAGWGLAVLTAINLFNYLDRWVVAAVVESLKKDLALDDFRIGLLATGFIVVYTVTSPLFGILGDRGSRPKLLAAGVAVWSLATALAGRATGFVSLFLARSTVGIGEAAYGTISPGLLADYYPKSRRGRVFAVFFVAIPVGSALGYVVGGLVDHRWGWRAAFYVAGLPGLLLALSALALPDPPRGSQDEEGVHEGPPPSTKQVYRDLLRNVPYLLVVLGYAAYTFAIGGLAFWAPAFLERIRGVPKSQATVEFGAIVVVTGLVGTFAGGWLGDALLKRWKEAYLWVSGAATLLAVPAAVVALAVPSRSVYLPAIVVTEILLFVSTGPVNSAIVNVVSPRERASAVALSIFAMHILGDVPSPPLIGALSEASDLGKAVLVVPVAIAAAGAIWTWAAWRGERGERGKRPGGAP
jgi:MFS transporter, Spinster family, sphingosine-1-phosphate transporter